MGRLITRIEISNFRGIGGALLLDAPKGGSVLVWARNGDGKSSIADALDWFFQPEGHVGHLKFSGMKPARYRHLAHLGTPASVKVTGERDGVPFSCERRLSPDGSATSIPAPFDSATAPRRVLRFADLEEFVREQPKPRYERLAKLLGLNGLTDLEDELDGALRDFSGAELDTKDRALSGQLRGLTGLATFEPATALYEWSNAKVARVGGRTTVTSRETIERAADELDGLARDVAVASRVAEIRDAQGALRAVGRFRREAARMLDTVAAAEARRDDEMDGIADGQFLRVLEAAAMDLVTLPDGDVACPLCERGGIQGIALRQRVQDRLGALARACAAAEGVSSVRRGFDALIKETVAALTRLAELLRDLGASERARDVTRAAAIVRASGRERDTAVLGARLPVVAEALRRVAGRARRELRDQERLAEERSRAGEVRAIISELRRLLDLLDDKARLDAERAAYEELHAQFDRVVVKYHAWVEDIVSTKLSDVSTDLGQYYTALHPDEATENVALAGGTRQKQATVSLRFHGHDLDDPRACLSTSHLNSLGLCAFLANIRHAAADDRFIVLDDVITSFDIEHRHRVIDLLATRFSDFQVLLLTHDEWVLDETNRLRNSTMKGWVVYELLPWDFDAGPRIQGRLPSEAAIKAELAAGNARGAGNQIRTYAEELCKTLCERCDVRLPFRLGRRQDDRMLGDLLAPLHVVLAAADPSGSPPVDAALLSALESRVATCNWLSHDRREGKYCTSLGEAKDAWKSVSQLKAATTCPKCGAVLKRLGTSVKLPCTC